MIIVRLRELKPNETKFFGIRSRSSIGIEPCKAKEYEHWFTVKPVRERPEEELVTLANLCSDVLEVRIVDDKDSK